ncbi:endonuclease/exonuclease/phosphatase family protein [Pelagimonas varians]|uniref:Endonuclease/Exonuclease/phosphatase family protein n=1 Tax=Pelagimonas varians TaxID=696760 RepID=A0A238KWR4_9RHOB|nr:endonuclease/exonuclease/phosphatase family protein [Pelagimonas varians]PYG28007.1 endonuclease/exonuclease/phosphatase family metal-dependent hydrolase [Pelagimonas varians]SMX47070.1 Endonuclease/Exonuclease/phosphatase family protein [Pelagimonas varians]
MECPTEKLVDIVNSQGRLRLASYNIQKSVGLDFRRDPGRIVDIINRLDADVIALQEVDKRLGDRPSSIARELVENSTDFQIAELAQNSVSMGWHGNAVLVRKGLTIHSVDHLTLPGLEPRGAVQVNLGDKGKLLSVVGVHLGLLRPFRRAQLEKIRAHLDDSDVDDAVIMGDFNEWSSSVGLEPLADGFEIISPGKSFHSARPLAGLDRFALGHRLELLDAGVDQSSSAKIASDHLPIWGDIRVNRGKP